MELREAGVRAVILERDAWTPAARVKLVGLAAKAKLQLIEPRRAPHTGPQLTSLHTSCGQARAPLTRCAIVAHDASDARDWLRRGSVNYVTVGLPSPQSVQQARWPRSPRTKVVGIVRLRKDAVV